MKKLLLVLIALALSNPVLAQTVTSNQFPGFGTTTGTAIQGPGVLGDATATTAAIGGCTKGADALCVTGTTTLGGNATVTGALIASISNGFAVGGAGTTTGIQVSLYNTGLGIGSAAPIYWTSGNLNAAGDLFIGRQGAASLRLGNIDVDTAPVAQTLRTQGTLAGGTSNVAGANWTFIASPGKGTGTGGSFIFQTAPAGSTGTVVNTPVTAMTIDSTGKVTFAGAIQQTAPLSYTHQGTQSPTATSSASAVMMGLGGSSFGTPWTLTPANGQKFRITVGGILVDSATVNSVVSVDVAYGTGTAPANGVALPGGGTACNVAVNSTAQVAAIQASTPFSLTCQGTGTGAAIWADLTFSSSSGSASVKPTYIFYDAL